MANNNGYYAHLMFILVGAYFFVQSPCDGVTLNLGILAVFDNPNSRMSLKKSGSAINIACDALVKDRVLDNITLNAVWRETYEPSDGVGNCVDLVMNEDVDVIFGSPSSRVTEATGHLTRYWNLPHITWSGNSYELSNKLIYTTLIRTRGPLSELGKALVTMFQSFDWNKVGMLYIDNSVCLYSASGIKDKFAKNNIIIMQNIGYPPNTLLTDTIIDSYLALIRQNSRIVFICVDDEIRRFMLRACKLDMCDGDFLFIYSSLSSPPETSDWSNGDSDDGLAKVAFRNVIHISVADWFKEEGKANLDKFNAEVVERMSEPPWYSDYAKVNNVTASDSSQYLYEAVYLYGLWYNYSLQHGVPLRDGQAMLQFSKGRSFYGISGPCDMGDNSDRVPYFWLWNFIGEGDSFRPEIVAISKTKEQEIAEVLGFQWNTRDGKPPKDEPECGFLNEQCTVVQMDNSTVVIAACVSIFVVLVVLTVIVYYVRKRQLENIMMQSIWKVDINQIELRKSKLSMGSLFNFKTPLSRPISSEASSNGATENSVHNAGVCILTTVGMYKGGIVSIRNVKLSPKHLTGENLKHLKAMKELHHDNVNPFIGACLETEFPCVLFPYCPKGSLLDVLKNDDIRLDLSFKYSLMMDLTQGMNYIQQSKIGSHGSLKSTNCLVDNRWALKITDYGMGDFINISRNKTQEEHQKYKSLLWTAPELLNEHLNVKKKSKEGDVYSYGIILHEIFYRMGTFAGRADMTAKDIVERVRSRDSSPYRPDLFNDNIDIIPAVTKLMQLCWIDNEVERPTLSGIRAYIKKNIPGINANIIDVVLQRLEKYASNLEELVEQRTQQLMLEKQKTDRLLYRMLPPSCAESLKMGEPVVPEIYESATVFFSDICGFTTIASKSSPIQVVDFLNDLYTCFDAIIAKHDAYKVETIGDAYLVVSGIPKRIGNLHSGVIADMSLDIRQGVVNFKIKHMPSENLRVRIGIHTGSCCAGVVGLSMPRYCLFGDTVNTASRMESNGESQQIHMSESACHALQNLGGYNIRLRGDMPIKGKGIMTTYWLDAKATGQVLPKIEIPN